MKKGIDVKIINGNVGLPDRESLGETKWRKAKPHSYIADAMGEFYINLFNPTIDIEYTEVRDEHKELPGHIMTFDECEKAYTDMMDKSCEPGQYTFFHSFKTIDPNDSAFCGHPLNSK